MFYFGEIGLDLSFFGFQSGEFGDSGTWGIGTLIGKDFVDIINTPAHVGQATVEVGAFGCQNGRFLLGILGLLGLVGENDFGVIEKINQVVDDGFLQDGAGDLLGIAGMFALAGGAGIIIVAGFLVDLDDMAIQQATAAGAADKAAEQEMAGSPAGIGWVLA